MQRKFIWVFLLCSVMIAPSPAMAEIHGVTILHTNDFHSQLDQKEMLLAKLRTLRQAHPDSLLLDGGDMFEERISAVSETDGAIVVDLMNEAGYDAMTLGDNEFQALSLKKILACVSRMNFPVLCANLVDEDRGTPVGIPYWIYTVNNVQIGVIGLYNEENLEKHGVLMANPKKSAVFYMDHLKGKVDCLILLSHQGLKNDREMAHEIEGYDVIIGSSSQTKLEKPEEVEGTLIVQAGGYGRYVGVLELLVDTDHNRIDSYRGKLVQTNQ